MKKIKIALNIIVGIITVLGILYSEDIYALFAWPFGASMVLAVIDEL